MEKVKGKAACALCVSSSSGGGGKTLLSLGLARALSRQGFLVKTFKKGPDYIDAAWLALASGRACTNLDPFFLSKEDLQDLFSRSLARLDKNDQPVFALLEGNRGLYDGLDWQGSCSTAELARTLSCPVLLTIDCTKMTRTVAAVVQGLVHFDRTLSFAGLVLNRVGTSRQAELLKKVVETYTDVTVLGVLPRLSRNPLPERHMGLASRGDRLAEDADARLEQLASHVTDHVDVHRLIAASARTVESRESTKLKTPIRTQPSESITLRKKPKNVRIGVLNDAAFWFYYEENLEALRSHGAELVPIALVGEQNAAQAMLFSLNGLYIGGGFPEDYAASIAQNPLLKDIAHLGAKGLPIYAECGGLMLLSRSLQVKDQRYAMAGLVPVDIEFCSKPQGLGYTEGCLVTDTPYYPKGTHLKGHEFHYSRLLSKNTLQKSDYVLALSRGRGMGEMDGCAYDGFVLRNVWASYTHIFAPAVPVWAASFTRLASRFTQDD